MPFMEWVMMTNQKLVLPDFLKGLENWIRRKEDETMQITLLLLKMAGTKVLVINLFMIAFVPAVSEELMFRGGVQRTFGRIFESQHAAIWLSAAVFSAIHVQFYGFLPRMLLGAGFGYIYLWSGSLWYSMLGHFINNAYAVCVAFYMQKQNMDISKMDSVPQFAWYGYLISFALTILVFQIFKKQTTNLS
jgi:membrane protease YdiL (CAAX protease family)